MGSRNSTPPRPPGRSRKLGAAHSANGQFRPRIESLTGILNACNQGSAVQCERPIDSMLEHPLRLPRARTLLLETLEISGVSTRAGEPAVFNAADAALRTGAPRIDESSCVVTSAIAGDGDVAIEELARSAPYGAADFGRVSLGVCTGVRAGTSKGVRVELAVLAPLLRVRSPSHSPSRELEFRLRFASTLRSALGRLPSGK